MNQFRIEGNVVWIKLTQDKEACVDLADWGFVRHHKWCVDGRYVVARVCGKNKRLHRFILNPTARQAVDHVNNNGLDNRRANLRLCSHAQNMANQAVNRVSTSGFKGVYWSRHARKWQAYITRNKKRCSLGYFSDKLEAARAYNAAAVKQFGAFARLNVLGAPR